MIEWCGSRRRESYWVNCIPSAVSFAIATRMQCNGRWNGEKEIERCCPNEWMRLNGWMTIWYQRKLNAEIEKNSSRSVYILWMQWMQYNFFISVSSPSIHFQCRRCAIALQLIFYYLLSSFGFQFGSFSLHFFLLSFRMGFFFLFSFSASSCSSFSHQICFVCS